MFSSRLSLMISDLLSVYCGSFGTIVNECKIELKPTLLEFDHCMFHSEKSSSMFLDQIHFLFYTKFRNLWQLKSSKIDN